MALVHLSLVLVTALLALSPWTAAQPANLEQSTRHARQLLDQGKFAEALPLLLDLRKAAPDNTSLGMTIAQTYANTGDFQNAILEYEAVRRRLPNFKPAVVSLATLYLNRAQGREGIALLAEYASRNPNDADVRSLLASAYQAQGDLSRANEQLVEVSRLQPKEPQIWFALHQNYQAILRECITLAEQADPESAPMVAMAGLERFRVQQDESAFYLLREAQRRDPRLRALHPDIAAIYTNRNQPAWAQQELAKEESLGKPDCQQDPAACAYLANNLPDVMAATRFARLPQDLYWRYRAALRLGQDAYTRLQELPPSVQSHGARAEWHRQRNRHAEAVKAWRDALALAPANLGLRKELVVSLLQSRDLVACAREADALLRDAPTDPELLLIRGDAALNQQKAAEALPYFQRALQAEPEMAPAQASLGRALLQLSRAAEAIPYLEKALPFAPDPSILYQLSQAYQQVGQANKAAETLARYQQLTRKDQQDRTAIESRFQITPP
ncbi:MAG: tetratricopeptide repeat protein [Bryobacterales bacterium]|jgi:predicted Zn-dependent protease|nr:tetratricopeptide repeat protein [Bryobacterales bacterium]